MFRNLIFIILSVISILTVSLSAVNYGMAGCGLGSMVPAWKNDISQVMAATTNGSSSNQTFGITSGTSNCTNDGIVKAEKAQEIFVHYNQAGLESEMAAGSGERINAFAQLLGCPTHSSELGELVKKNYSKIVTTETRKDSKLLLASLKKEVGSDLKLSEACQF
ncbi:DUF3015 domain-containing protein [Leptospira sp. 'Mane']|uniref:DUF3015 domain-containing protein n=1 Tax=Leptospira sp. 'Mane' TaxID=3387407 RepID=UPI00398BB993